VHWRQHLTPYGAYSHALEAGIDDRFFDNNVDFSGTQLGVDVRSRPLTLAYNARYDQANSIVAANVQYVRNLGGGRDNNDAAYSGNRAGASPGLREREVTGDSGTTVSVEAMLPLPWTGFSAVAFLDAGEVRSHDIAAGQRSHEEAASVGFGMRYNLPRRLSVAIDAAHVLNGTTVTSAGDRRVHASFVFRF
jgi:outer membrane protein assembly factor BamA